MVSTELASDKDASTIFTDILEARAKGSMTLLINAANGHRFIEPMQIVDCSITDTPMK
jgi:hypothetical protein